MDERAVRFQCDGLELVGRLTPAKGEPRGAVLVVHPMGEEKKFAHRVLVQAAWRLANAGLTVLRFDLGGSGDSFGRFRDMTLSAWRRQVVSAAELLVRETGSAALMLLGLRLGASLCWMARNEVPGAEALTLWEPVLSGKQYVESLWQRKLVREMLTGGRSRTTLEASRRELARTGFMDLDGWDVGAGLVDELTAMDLAASVLPPFPARALAVQIGFNAKVSAALETFAANVRAGGGAVETVGLRERPIWDRIDIVPAVELIETTVSFAGRLTGN